MTLYPNKGNSHRFPKLGHEYLFGGRHLKHYSAHINRGNVHDGYQRQVSESEPLSQANKCPQILSQVWIKTLNWLNVFPRKANGSRILSESLDKGYETFNKQFFHLEIGTLLNTRICMSAYYIYMPLGNYVTGHTLLSVWSILEPNTLQTVTFYLRNDIESFAFMYITFPKKVNIMLS